MNKLVVIAYPKVDVAKEALANVKQLGKQHFIDLEDAVYVTHDAQGQVKLHQTKHFTSYGTVVGAVVGGIYGLLLLAPIATAVGGAITGGVMGKLTDLGIEDKFAQELGEQLPPDSSAILLLVRSASLDDVLPQIGKLGGKVLQTTLADDVEAQLKAALQQGSSDAS